MDTRVINRAIVSLDRIRPADEGLAGAKAYNCARLRQAGFQVPDGLVVLTTAEDDELAIISDDRWFDEAPADARFAVRSSAIGEDGEGQSFAGIHETRLNVARVDIGDAVDACRRSAQSAQAITYRHAKGISTDAIQTAVLIQRMVEPIAAGVAFTINPLTGGQDEVVINASWGLGEALVSGLVEPDEFGVRKADGEMLWQRLGEKDGTLVTRSALTLEQARELTTIAVAIERHYGAPQDIEWCHDGRSFWIVQSRPVTGAARASNGIEWTRANLAEVLPELTSPQALVAFEHVLNTAETKHLGSLIAPEASHGPMVKAFAGRLYFNLSQLRHSCALSGFAPAEMLRSVGHADAIDPADEQPQPISAGARVAAVPGLLRQVWKHLRAASVVRAHDEWARAYLQRLAAIDARTLSDRELWSVVDEWFSGTTDAMQTVLLLSGVMFHETPVRAACARVGVAFEQLVYPQLALGERSVSAQQAFDLVALARMARREPVAVRHLEGGAGSLADLRTALGGTRFLGEFERFLEQYGHRGRYEYDWALPRYIEDPRPLLLTIRMHLQDEGTNDTPDTIARQTREAAAVWQEFESRLTRWQRWTMLPRVKKSIGRIKQYYVWRERVRSDLIRVLARLRTVHLELAHRFVERGWIDDHKHYFFLLFDEVAGAIGDPASAPALRGLAAARMAEMERHRAISMPLLMRESELPRLVRTANVSGDTADGGELTGQPVSGGCVEAEVVVVRDPADFAQMKRGAILVTRATDPSWTPLFTLASGVIVEVGGVLSHASTIAREYGLPALANVKHATKRLKTGERVRLDAIHGVIERIASAPAISP